MGHVEGRVVVLHGYRERPYNPDILGTPRSGAITEKGDSGGPCFTTEQFPGMGFRPESGTSFDVEVDHIFGIISGQGRDDVTPQVSHIAGFRNNLWACTIFRKVLGLAV